jgi:hypothetical protein
MKTYWSKPREPESLVDPYRLFGKDSTHSMYLWKSVYPVFPTSI